MASHMLTTPSMKRLDDRQKIERLRAELYLLLEQERQGLIVLTDANIADIAKALELTI